MIRVTSGSQAGIRSAGSAGEAGGGGLPIIIGRTHSKHRAQVVSPPIGCNTFLPNGEAISLVVSQGRSLLGAAALPVGNDPSEASPIQAQSIIFRHFVRTGGPTDFKIVFGGPHADENVLGLEGNFAYFATGTGILPDSELFIGASYYALGQVFKGQKTFSDLTGFPPIDRSASTEAGPGLASNGC
jgi:hypothetical protein